MDLLKHHHFMWRFTRMLLKGIRNRMVLGYLVTLSFTVMGLCSILFYWIEGTTNPKVQSMLDALYFTVTVMTGVGLGDITPLSWQGKILSMGMMLLGTAIFVCFTAVLGVLVFEIGEVEVKDPAPPKQ